MELLKDLQNMRFLIIKIFLMLLDMQMELKQTADLENISLERILDGGLKLFQ